MRSTIHLRWLLLLLTQVCIGCVLSLQAQPTYDSCLAPIEKVVEEYSYPGLWNPDSIKIDTCGGSTLSWGAAAYAYRRFTPRFSRRITHAPQGVDGSSWEVIDTIYKELRQAFAELERRHGTFRLYFGGSEFAARMEFDRYVRVYDILGGILDSAADISRVDFEFILGYPAGVGGGYVAQETHRRGSDLSIWPNPSVGHVEIARPSSMPWSPLLIHNVLGDIVRTIIPNNPTEDIITIQLDALPSGVYMISSGQSRSMLVLQ